MLSSKETKLKGVFTVVPKMFEDGRGFFMESWHEQAYAKLGLPTHFVQDNFSLSSKGILRGLHFQNPQPQGKFVSVLQGEIFDVAVDIRVGSPTFGQWVGVILSSENRQQFYIPEGFAHGFCTLSDEVLVHYKCTDYYNPKTEHAILWNDPDIGIDWPLAQPQLSNRDEKASLLSALSNCLPLYSAS